MKVKENYSNEFKGDDTMKTSKILREKEDLMLCETVYREDYLPYSEYVLRNEFGNIAYIRIFIPDPIKKDLYKDIYLKYQVGIRKFLIQFFDVLIGESENVRPIYKTKQKKDFVCEKTESGCALIKPIGDNFLFGIIDFPEDDENLELAEKIVGYFEGEKIDFSDEAMI